MSDYQHVEIPERGEKIGYRDGQLIVPDEPIIPYIEGDGTGKDISPVMREVLDGAVEKVYDGDREIVWTRIYAGESAEEVYGTVFPAETLDAIREFRIAIKGPLTTPVGAGFRSLNVALRQQLDLYACVRPVYYLDGLPSPVCSPEEVDFVIFRENTEDVYAGIEWEAETNAAEQVREFVETELGAAGIHEGPVGLGLKPISEFATKRLVRRAIDYALEHDRESVTLVHKGNIMKFTEGAFCNWGYEVADQEYGEEVITEDQLWDNYDGQAPDGTLVVKDRIADNMLQQILTRTSNYDVLALPNLNGDYISDAAGGMIGGLGICPGANFGDGRALFEPTHGSAPKHAGKDKVNPTALILSACEMLDHIGWAEASAAIKQALQATFKEKYVTYDLARQLSDAEKVKSSQFGRRVVENI